MKKYDYLIVGAGLYGAVFAHEAKKAGKQPKSEMMRSLTSLIKWIGFLVIPLGAVMFIKEYLWLKSPVADAVTSTVGSIVGMIPEGLYLLTSLALVAGVVRLAQRKTLVHELGCIETPRMRPEKPMTLPRTSMTGNMSRLRNVSYTPPDFPWRTSPPSKSSCSE